MFEPNLLNKKRPMPFFIKENTPFNLSLDFFTWFLAWITNCGNLSCLWFFFPDLSDVYPLCLILGTKTGFLPPFPQYFLQFLFAHNLSTWSQIISPNNKQLCKLSVFAHHMFLRYARHTFLCYVCFQRWRYSTGVHDQSYKWQVPRWIRRLFWNIWVTHVQGPVGGAAKILICAFPPHVCQLFLLSAWQVTRSLWRLS